jgi:hypothetical protein
MVPILFHAPFYSHQMFYNPLPCSPIPIGPYEPQNPGGSSSNFQHLVSNSLVQIFTFQIW